MSRKQYLILLVMTLLGNVIGGAVSERLVHLGVAMAQKAKGVSAEEFLLLDQSGKPRAGLGLDANDEVGLVLTSKDGARTLSLSPDERLAIKLKDREGRVLWSTP